MLTSSSPSSLPSSRNAALFTLSDFTRALTENDSALSSYATAEHAEKFHLLTEEMLRVNRYMNITAITEIPDILVKHYADCAMIVPYIPKNAVLCDVGCGGGFPTLPIAILRPDVNIVAVDSTQKKLDYVKNTAALLGLNNVTVQASRAESLGCSPTFRETFDFVTARAVARMNVLCEWCLPLVKPGGLFLAMKGKNGASEHAEAARAISILGGETLFCREKLLVSPFDAGAEIPAAKSTDQTILAQGVENDSDEKISSQKIPKPVDTARTDAKQDEEAMRRCLILIRKIKQTPKQYPRNNAQITKKPL